MSCWAHLYGTGRCNWDMHKIFEACTALVAQAATATAMCNRVYPRCKKACSPYVCVCTLAYLCSCAMGWQACMHMTCLWLYTRHATSL